MKEGMRTAWHRNPSEEFRKLDLRGAMKDTKVALLMKRGVLILLQMFCAYGKHFKIDEKQKRHRETHALFERGGDLSPDLVNALVCIRKAEFAGLSSLVMREDRHGLVVVLLEALRQRLFVVVRALHERLSGLVVPHVLRGRRALPVVGLRRRKLRVERPTRCLVDPATADPLCQHFIRDLEFDDLGDALAPLRERSVQSLGLLECPREAVE